MVVTCKGKNFLLKILCSIVYSKIKIDGDLIIIAKKERKFI